MRKYVFLLVILCLSLGTLLCSPTEGKSFQLKSGMKRVDDKIFTMGPQISLILTDIHFNGDVKAGFSPGFGAGVFFRIGKMVHFQPEIFYSLRKFTFNPPFQELENNAKVFTHSLSFTPMIGCAAVNNEDFKFRIFFGPEGGILLKNGYAGSKNPWTKFEYGGKIGIGFDAYKVTFDVGYKFLMSKNSDIIAAGITTEYQRQNMIFFSFGYCIF
jgi:hypothetical protein